MNATAYVVGFLRLATVLVPSAACAIFVRRGLAPNWTGSLALLAGAVGTIGTVVVLGEALGTLGLFRYPDLAIACILAASAAYAWWRSVRQAVEPFGGSPVQPDGEDHPGISSGSAQGHWTDALIVASSVGLVAAQWTGWMGQALDTGIGGGGGPANGDTLWYHMPFAADFAQSGWTSRLYFLNADPAVTYYPANTSLLHGVGLLALRSDFLSVFFNFALIPLGLLAGWCIGRGRGVGAATLAGVAAALTLPVVAVSEAGTAKDDMLGLVGLVAAVAFVVDTRAVADARDRLAAALFGGLAAGLALGSKLTLVVPVAALGVGLFLLTPRTERRGAIGRWILGALAGGGYWYGRNLFAVGNPIPEVGVHIGPLRLPRPPIASFDHYGSSVARHIGDHEMWRSVFIPGLGTGFGDGWPLIVAILALSVGLGLLRLRRQDLVPVIVTLCATGAFLLTPGTVWGAQFIRTPGIPHFMATFFSYTLRYLLPAVAVGLAIVPLAVTGWRYGRVLITAFIGVILIATQLNVSSNGGWSGNHAGASVVVGCIAALCGGGLVLYGKRRARRPSETAGRPALRFVVIGVVGALVVAAAWPLQVTYRANRFATMPLARWANSVAPARIGYSGFVFSYPLFGPHLENSVTMVGQRGPDGAWHAASTCLAWRRQVRLDHLQYVLVPIGPPSPLVGIDLARWKVGLPGGSPPDEPPESGWTRSDPGARAVFVGWGVGVYAIHGPASRAGCT